MPDDDSVCVLLMLQNGGIADITIHNMQRVWISAMHAQEYEYEEPASASLTIEEAERFAHIILNTIKAVREKHSGTDTSSNE